MSECMNLSLWFAVGVSVIGIVVIAVMVWKM